MNLPGYDSWKIDGNRTYCYDCGEYWYEAYGCACDEGDVPDDQDYPDENPAPACGDPECEEPECQPVGGDFSLPF